MAEVKDLPGHIRKKSNMSDTNNDLCLEVKEEEVLAVNELEWSSAEVAKTWPEKSVVLIRLFRANGSKAPAHYDLASIKNGGLQRRSEGLGIMSFGFYPEWSYMLIEKGRT